jgi:hypothetical protein
LLQHALELLTLGPHLFDERLAEVWDASSVDLVKSTIIDRVSEGSSAASLASWRLLFLLAQQPRHGWAAEMIPRLWPSSIDIAARICSQVRLPLPTQAVIDRLASIIATLGPTVWSEDYSPLIHFLARNKQDPAGLDYSALRKLSLMSFYFEEENRLRFRVLPKLLGASLAGETVRLDSRRFERFRGADLNPAKWAVFLGSGEFGSNPSSSTLADALELVATSGNLEIATNYLYALPWPIATILDEAESDQHLLELARGVRLGNRGDTPQWRAAEIRWHEAGVSEEDLLALRSGSWFGASVERLGAPCFDAWPDSAGRRYVIDAALNAVRLFEALAGTRYRHRVASIVAAVLSVSAKCNDAGAARRLLSALIVGDRAYLYPETLVSFDEDLWIDPSLVDLFSEVLNRVPPHIGPAPEIAEKTVKMFNKFPDHRKLLLPVVKTTIGYENVRVDLMANLSSEGSTPKNDDPSSILAAASLIRMALNRSTPTQVDEDIVHLLNEGPPYWALNLASMLLGTDVIPLNVRLLISTKLIHAIRAISFAESQTFIEPLWRCLDARKSALTDRRIWMEDLRMP